MVNCSVTFLKYKGNFILTKLYICQHGTFIQHAHLSANKCFEAAFVLLTTKNLDNGLRVQLPRRVDVGYGTNINGKVYLNV